MSRLFKRIVVLATEKFSDLTVNREFNTAPPNPQPPSRNPQHPKGPHLPSAIKYVAYIGAALGLITMFSRYKRRRHKEIEAPIVDAVKKIEPVKFEISKAPEDPQAESLRKKYNFIDKIVKKCVPAVFYLEIQDPYKRDPETGKPIVTSNGSGFMISEDGYALTNAHVVLNKPDSLITAVMHDGTTYGVKVEDADLNIDLALLKLHGNTKFQTLRFGEAGDASVGEWVVALGSPLSLSNSVTVGIVSNVNRPAEELGLKNYSMTYIQTDASITFGNSGGPLVNLDGNVIGINNLRLTSGISFAIPVDYARRFLENNKLMNANRVKNDVVGKTLFGLTTISITSELLNDLLRRNKIVPDEVTQGLLVWKVLHGTPAQKSGLEAGDIITHVNGVPVKEAGDIYAISQKEKTVTVGIIHKGLRREIILDNTT